MKIAVEVSGLQRYGTFFPELVETLGSTFGHVDFFFHHWQGPRDNVKIAAMVQPSHPARVIKQEKQIDFNLKIKPEWKDLGYACMHNLLSMSYSLRKVNQLRKDYERRNFIKYDLIVRARSDIRLKFWPASEFWFKGIPKDTILVGHKPDYLENNAAQIQDQFSISSSDNADKYADLYNAFDKFHASGGKFHPETFLRWHLNDRKMVIDESVFLVELEKANLPREARAVY